MSHITAIRELLETAAQSDLFPVDVYLGQLPTWTEMVLSYPDGWTARAGMQQPFSMGAFDGNSLTLLRTLGPQLRPLVPSWSDGQRESFAQSLNELIETLRDDPTIKGDLAKYLLNLVLHMRHVLAEYELLGDFDLTRAVFLLKASVDTAADNSTDPKSKTAWERIRSVFSFGAVATKAAIETKDIWGPLVVPGA